MLLQARIALQLVQPRPLTGLAERVQRLVVDHQQAGHGTVAGLHNLLGGGQARALFAHEKAHGMAGVNGQPDFVAQHPRHQCLGFGGREHFRLRQGECACREYKKQGDERACDDPNPGTASKWQHASSLGSIVLLLVGR